MGSRGLAQVSLAALVASLLALAVRGWFARYAADDYCTAGQVAVEGFLRTQSILYTGWSGRFGATLFITLAELSGPLAVRVLPALALLAWLAAGTFATRELGRALGWHAGWLRSAVVASVVVYATLHTTADLPQVLYWQTGLLTYLLPLVLFTLLVGWNARCVRTPPRHSMVGAGVGGVLAVLAGGSSETFAAAQLTALALAVVGGWRLGLVGSGRRLQTTLLASLAGAAVALAIVAAAPGNGVRESGSVGLPVPIALVQAVEFTRGWLRLTVARPHVIELLLVVGIPAGVAATSAHLSPRLVDWRVIAFGLASLALVLLSSMLPAFVALGSNPPGRAQLIPQYALLCGLAALGWLLGAWLGARVPAVVSRRAGLLHWASAAGLLALLVMGPLASSARVADQLVLDGGDAAAWDALDRQVRADQAQGVQDVTVPRLAATSMVHNLDFVGPDREDWFNVCVARYYGVRSIAATEE